MSLSVSPILAVTPSKQSKQKRLGKLSSAREMPEGERMQRKTLPKVTANKFAPPSSKANGYSVHEDEKSKRHLAGETESKISANGKKRTIVQNKYLPKPQQPKRHKMTLDESIESRSSAWTEESIDVDDVSDVVLNNSPHRKKRKLLLVTDVEDDTSVNFQGDSKEKATDEAKNKKKPIKVLKESVEKVKLAVKTKKSGEKSDTTTAAAKKRPLSGKLDSGKEKKPKLEEMSFKDRKQNRKMHSKNYECGKAALKLWEKLRIFEQSADERRKVYDELFKLVSGKVLSLTTAHDTARVVQALIKYGTAEQRNVIFDQLKGNILEMTKSTYAKFIVRKILKYGSKGHRDCVFNALHGHVRKLVRHKEAADIVECAYNGFANATQRAAMVEEFYGPVYAIYKTTENCSLGAVITAYPDKRESILSSMKETLSVLVEKNSLQHTFVHKLFIDYFTFASEKLRAEMIETLKDGVVHMVHTKEGARVGMICIWHGTAKDRKAIIKSFKTFVIKICKEEFGHYVMLALFDVVDDTKIVQKAILDELLKSVNELAKDLFGRKVLLYLLAPRNPLHFHPDVVAILQQGDNNAHSKKDVHVRRNELLTYVSRPLVQWIVQHANEHVLDNALLLLVLSVIQHVKCDPTEAMRAIALIAAKRFCPEDTHLVEHPAGHLTLKRLILNDVERMKQGDIVLFSNILLDVLPDGSLESWTTCNRGCFIVISLLETGNAEVISRVNKQLQNSKATLSKREFKGAQILLKKLEGAN